MIKTKILSCTRCKKQKEVAKTRLVAGIRENFCLTCWKITKEGEVKAKKAKVRVSKKFNKTTLMKAADTIFSLYIRLRDTNSAGVGTCCSSGKIIEWSSIDCGHYIPRGYMKYRYSEQNCHAQSKNDNSRLHGNIPEYRRFMEKKYGEEFERQMFLDSKQFFKPESDFFLGIIQKYLEPVLILLATKDFDTTNYFTFLNRYKKTYL